MHAPAVMRRQNSSGNIITNSLLFRSSQAFNHSSHIDTSVVSRESGVVSRDSGVVSRESGVVSRESGVGSRKYGPRKLPIPSSDKSLNVSSRIGSFNRSSNLRSVIPAPSLPLNSTFLLSNHRNITSFGTLSTFDKTTKSMSMAVLPTSSSDLPLPR